MHSHRVSVGVCGCLLTLTAWALAQDAKKDSPPSKDDSKVVVVTKHPLPQHYKQLGLSDEQKKQLARVQTDFGMKIDELQAQINKLKQEEKQAMEKLLTDAQRAQLLDILKTKAGSGDSKSGDSKTGDGKSGDKPTDKK